MGHLSAQSVDEYVRRLCDADPFGLQEAHAHIVETAIQALTASGFSPPQRLTSASDVASLCAAADAAHAFAYGGGSLPDIAECAADALQAVAGFHLLYQTAQSAPEDEAVLARLVIAATLIGHAEGVLINAGMSVIDSAAELHVRANRARWHGEAGARMRHAGKESQRERVRALFAAARSRNPKLTASGWAKSVEGKESVFGLKRRALAGMLSDRAK